MARVGHVLEAAPAVGNLLVLGQRVGDEREAAQVLLERPRQRRRRQAPLLAVRIHQEIERRLDGERLAADPETQAGDGFVELPVPGRIAGHRLLVEQLLDPVLELIGLLLAHVLDPGPVMTERGVAHGGIERGIVDAVELEREEQQMHRSGGDALLQVAVELGALRIGGVAGIDQRGVGHQPAERVVERLVPLDRRGERRTSTLARRHLGELALIGLLEGLALVFAILQVPLQFRAFHAGIEVVRDPIPAGRRDGTASSTFAAMHFWPWRGDNFGERNSRRFKTLFMVAGMAMRWRAAIFSTASPNRCCRQRPRFAEPI